MNYARPRAPTLTLETLEEAMAEIRALPRVRSDVTIAPSVLHALEALGVGDPVAMVQRIAGPGLTVHVDARLPPGMWHWGEPIQDASLARMAATMNPDRKAIP